MRIERAAMVLTAMNKAELEAAQTVLWNACYYLDGYLSTGPDAQAAIDLLEEKWSEIEDQLRTVRGVHSVQKED